MTDLQTAAQQALEALYEADTFHRNLPDQRARRLAAMAALRAALAQQAEHICDTHCTWADHAAGCVRAEPVQEPVAISDGTFNHDCPIGTLLYTAPPRQKPLTEEEILKAIGWERAEMYMKLTPNFPIEEARKETIKNARAIERAHGIKE